MLPQISKITELKENSSIATLFDNIEQISLSLLSENESDYLRNKLVKENDCTVYKHPNIFYFNKIKEEKENHIKIEEARKAGSKLFDILKTEKIKTIQLINFSMPELTTAFLEGLLLSGYSFDKYKKEKDDYHIEEIFIFDKNCSLSQIEELKNLTQAVFYSRDLVNEPLSFLTAPQFSKEIEKMAEESGFSVDVFNKKKIETLKMGGLLAVNKGSIDPPTFNVLEWKSENAKNGKPIVLVGKGVVFDTGGLSLKPTANSMDHMKCDMSGAATVAGVMYAIAKSDFNVHVVGLVPATDNRPGQNAYYPGDVINMYDGSTVEVLNTDAEGRMLLADALAYAKNYDPQLVIDIATLTGSSAMAIGKYGIVSFSNSDEDENLLSKSGEAVYERLVRFPIWEEYAELIKSDIADVKNIGGPQGGAITAAKFLERFTDYNWIHLDIAGPAFIQKDYKYFTKGGTAIGVRLIFDFLKKININE